MEADKKRCFLRHNWQYYAVGEYEKRAFLDVEYKQLKIKALFRVCSKCGKAYMKVFTWAVAPEWRKLNEEETEILLDKITAGELVKPSPLDIQKAKEE